MSFVDDPVINSPFEEPKQHHQLNEEGQPTGIVSPGRRPSMQVVPVAAARRRVKQGELELGESNELKINQLVNDIRDRVGVWRSAGRKGISPETQRLLDHWTGPDRGRKLFFCQIEALETLIYLTEVDPDRFKAKIQEANDEANPGLNRLASKMATGSGKTTVIAGNLEIDLIWERFHADLDSVRQQLNAALNTSWQEWEVPSEADASWTEPARKAHAEWRQIRGSRQRELDASIARGAESQPLYDRPYKGRGVVRVSGPFTVESLSPHRVLPLEEDPVLLDALRGDDESVAVATAGAEQTDFAQVVLEQLKSAGVQNTKKGEAIKFDWLKPFASKRGYIAFEGVYLENGEERRAAVAIGPEYDTVGYDFVRGAAREAATLFDTLIVCGFAFAPEVDESRLNLGNLNVLKARMNQDLRMSDKLKATGAGNLFVVFGEPDIAVEDAGDGMVRVAIKGVDIFDPTTGEVKSSDDPSEDIACWFIDDDYDEESFFVRQAYFLGRDPYESLKRALKAEIDEAAWAELNSTVSRAFPRPATGRICVKVINHFGDEVQKVFDV